MRCCCCNSEFYPKWDKEKKEFEKDCAVCVATYSKRPPNKFAMSCEETDDVAYALMNKLSNELGLQDNENITLEDVVRVDRGNINGNTNGEEENESDMDRPNWS